MAPAVGWGLPPAVGALVGFYHLQRRKQTPVAAALHAHLFADPSLLARLLGPSVPPAPAPATS